MKIKLVKLLFVSIVLLTTCKSKYDTLEDGVYADIKTKKGSIVLELYAKDVPMTVANFITLAEGTNSKVTDSLKGRRYYDGLKFHRVSKNFVIQGGDPLGNGLGGPGYKFHDEFPKDSTGNLLYRHDAGGVLSMANSGPSANGSQFFITHRAAPHLDGVHSIFGKVVTGQNVVDSIVKNDTITSITIIRKGKEAKSFDAARVFDEGIAQYEVLEKERLAKVEAEKEAFIATTNAQKAKAAKLASGLQIFTFEKGTGKKVKENTNTTIHYTLYLSDGKKIQSTVGQTPFTFNFSKRPMIAGFKEGLLKMKQGGKARLFIPYYLAYGERGGGPFPPKADIIFDIEVLKVE
ncbi:MAG: peptidylprolyl isomerase [Flavobacteriaceae bacterium]|nr:MAG: peptidylprolyl isomerase [Flavobacteriaceae bacterium]